MSIIHLKERRKRKDETDMKIPYPSQQEKKQSIDFIVNESLPQSEKVQRSGFQHYFSKINKQKRWLLVAVALLILIPTTAFAANKIYEVITQKEGYLTTLLIDKKEKDTKPAQAYRLDFDYVPQGLTRSEGRKISYKSSDSSEANIVVGLSQADGTKAEITMSEGTREEEINGHTVWFVKRAVSKVGGYPLYVYVLFEEENILATLYFDDTVSDEAMGEMIAGMKLTPVAEGEGDEIYIPFEDDGKADFKPVDLKKNAENLKEWGKAFKANEKLEITVDQLKVSKQVSDYDQQATEDYNPHLETLLQHDLITSDGTLLSYEAELYKLGDGKKTLDEKVQDLTITPKYVSMNFTLKNTSKEDITDFYFVPSLAEVSEVDGGFHKLMNRYRLLPDIGYDEPFYMNPHGEGKGYYNIGDIPAGETREITIGFLQADTGAYHHLLGINLTGAAHDDMNDKEVQWLQID